MVHFFGIEHFAALKVEPAIDNAQGILHSIISNYKHKTMLRKITDLRPNLFDTNQNDDEVVQEGQVE